MSLDIAETFELSFNKNNNVAYKALQKLQKESKETDCVHPYMDRLSDMPDNDNSYIRTRGLTLIAYNIKPITARQCIILLPIIAKYKPELKNDGVSMFCFV